MKDGPSFHQTSESFPAGSAQPEAAADNDGKGKESKSKKKSADGRSILAEVATGKAAQDEARGERVRESLWQRINTKPDAASDTPAEALFGIPRPDAVQRPNDAVRSETAAQPEAAAMVDDQTALRQHGHDMAELRLDAADGELHDLPLSQYETTEAAEAAAGIALMHEIRQRLAPDAAEQVDAQAAVDAAEQSVRRTIEQTAEDQSDPESETESQTEAAPEARPAPQGPPEGPPPLPPMPGAAEQAPPPDRRPEDRLSGDREQAVGERLTAAPVDPSAESVGAVPLAAAQAREQAAASRGVLVGGIAGYLIGRRRGRKQAKAAAEKQQRPLRSGLEKQVRQLQDTIANKEQQIRQTAREKVSLLTDGRARAKVIDRLLHPEAVRNQPGTPGRSASMEAAIPLTATPAAERVASERSGSVVSERPRPASANLGRVLVESPLVAVAAPIVAERQRALAATERAGIIPFDKTVEQFSQAELLVAAEKIKVQGVTLKEMTELGRLDEPGLRRVVAEFLSGGDVTRAFMKEADEKELQYERDPKLRAAAVAAAAVKTGLSGAAVAGSDGTAGGRQGAYNSGPAGPGNARAVGSNMVASAAASATAGRRPEPDAARLRELRSKQLETVTTFTSILAFIIVVVLLLTR